MARYALISDLTERPCFKICVHIRFAKGPYKATYALIFDLKRGHMARHGLVFDLKGDRMVRYAIMCDLKKDHVASYALTSDSKKRPVGKICAHIRFEKGP